MEKVKVRTILAILKSLLLMGLENHLSFPNDVPIGITDATNFFTMYPLAGDLVSYRLTPPN
jgi:hypothetical protein